MFFEYFSEGISRDFYSDEGFRRKSSTLDDYSLSYDRDEYSDYVTGLTECFGYRYSTKPTGNCSTLNKRRSSHVR